ncbi:MAG: NlpC/P60 family protein [Sphingomicrobium sp.]
MAAIDAERARALVGTPFRPQGRGGGGLDCIGLCLAAYRLPLTRVRADYRLRGDFRAEVEAFLADRFRKIAWSKRRPGDLLLMQPATDQMHLGIVTQLGFVHADARLRRVVETPGDPPWPLLGIYRHRRKAKS